MSLFASIQTCEFGWFICNQESCNSFIRQGIPAVLVPSPAQSLAPSPASDRPVIDLAALRPVDPAWQSAPTAKFERVTPEYLVSLRAVIERSLDAPKDVDRLLRVTWLYHQLEDEIRELGTWTGSGAEIPEASRAGSRSAASPAKSTAGETA